MNQFELFEFSLVDKKKTIYGIDDTTETIVI